MNRFYKYLIILLFLQLLSCSQKEELSGEENIVGEEVAHVSISRQPRKAAPGIDELLPGETAAIVIDNSIFNENSILYISQMGPTDNENPNFTNLAEDAVPYLYQYKFMGDNDATWDENYNFEKVTGRFPISWPTVKSIGSVGNSFSFYAMYFPVTETPGYSSTQGFSVAADQTGGEDNPYDNSNFIKSDILGAYHSTSALYTRMRFRLFHLMSYLKITLYVPVYESHLDEAGEMSQSGFEPGALQWGYMLNTIQNFDIEWRANRSSDTESPKVNPGNMRSNIKMYMEEPPQEYEPIQLPVQNYYPNGEMETDEVYAYNFSVLFPEQQFNDNFICFALKSIDNSIKYYYFSSVYTDQSNNQNGTFNFESGTLQQLYLYLPRTTNDAILVGAKILPWNNSSTDMTVFQTPQAGSEQPDNY